MVFSPSESHCATCGEDGSVRVWSLASMELVIQFQVLNQVGGESWGDWCMFKQSPGYVICSHVLKLVPLSPPWGNAGFPPPWDTRAASALPGLPHPVDAQSSSRWWQATATAHFESSASRVLQWNSRCTPTGLL